MPKPYINKKVKLTAKRLEYAKPIKRNGSEAHQNLSELITTITEEEIEFIILRCA